MDREKVLGACRAKLCRLRDVVDNDIDTMKKLKVVGVLQAGRKSANGNPYIVVSSTDNY